MIWLFGYVMVAFLMDVVWRWWLLSWINNDTVESSHWMMIMVHHKPGHFHLLLETS